MIRSITMTNIKILHKRNKLICNLTGLQYKVEAKSHYRIV